MLRLPPRDRLSIIGVLALPIVGGMMSQNVLNLVDTAMVGTLGDAALAGTGTGGFMNFVAVAAVMGLSAGVQAMASRRVGEGRANESALPLNAGLLIGVAVGLPLSVFFFHAAPIAFSYMTPDVAVVAAGAPYLQSRVCALGFAGMNFAYRGYWNGIGRPAIYFRTLLAMHGLNIFLNWVLIFGNLGAPELGTTGAGIASACATAFGALLYSLQALVLARGNGFLRALPSLDRIRTLAKLAVPVALQQTLFAGGFTMLFYIINQVGTAEGAAASVMINLLLLAILPGIALGFSAATLVGQALGRDDADDAEQWGWDVASVAFMALAAIGFLLVAFPQPLLSFFLHDDATVAIGTAPLQLAGALIGVDGVGLVLMHAIMGAGATRQSMVVTVTLQWGLFLPIAYLIGPTLGHGLLGIWGAHVTYRGLQAGIFAWLWRSRKWTGVAV
jgi:putative MATE family efflux protein